MRKVPYLLFTFTVLVVAPAYPAVVAISSDGTSVTKPDLATASTAADCAGKEISVDAPCAITSVVNWPSDRGLSLRKGCMLTFSGSGKLKIAANAPFKADLCQVFAGTMAVTFGTGSIRNIHSALFGDKGDGVNDDAAAIRAAIKSASAGMVVTILDGTHLALSTETPLNYEVASPAIRIPDTDITIEGHGRNTILQNGTNGSYLCMFQTTYGSSANVKLVNLHVQGTGNAGASSYALLDGVVVNGNTTHFYSDVTIDGTKRHGYYVIAGANGNTLKSTKISNANRTSLGCSVQIEGGSNNLVLIDEIVNSGGNAVDINAFTGPAPGTGIYYANTGPWGSTVYTPTHNVVKVKRIDGTGVNTGAAYDIDDDYYGVNLLVGSHNTVECGEIKSVRIANGSSGSTYASAIRLGSGRQNVVKVAKVSSIGPLVDGINTGCVAKLDSPQDSIVDVTQAEFYAAPILLNADSDTTGTTVFIRNLQGSVAPESLQGLNLKYVQQPGCTTSLNGVVSGWTGDYGLTFVPYTNGLQITVDASSFKKLRKPLTFSAPYVTVNFEYNQTDTAGATPAAGMEEPPFAGIPLVKDGLWHSASVIIPNAGKGATFYVSPNNSGTAANGSTLTIRNIAITLPDGTTLRDNSTNGLLNGPPTIGTYHVGDRADNYAPATGQSKGWRCVSAGSPGTWVSEGDL